MPNVPVLFWCFRLMVGLGLFFIALFATAFYLATRHRFESHRGFLRLAFCSLPLPWIAVELGWIVAEYGRQPWVVDGVLPPRCLACGATVDEVDALCGPCWMAIGFFAPHNAYSSSASAAKPMKPSSPTCRGCLEG